jgi:hypothetical protein
MIESVRKAFVTLLVFQVNHTETIFRCGNLGNVEIFETLQARYGSTMSVVSEGCACDISSALFSPSFSSYCLRLHNLPNFPTP